MHFHIPYLYFRALLRGLAYTACQSELFNFSLLFVNVITRIIRIIIDHDYDTYVCTHRWMYIGTVFYLCTLWCALAFDSFAYCVVSICVFICMCVSVCMCASVYVCDMYTYYIYIPSRPLVSQLYSNILLRHSLWQVYFKGADV